MGSWATGWVGGSHGGLGRGSQGWWWPQIPETFLCFNIEVTFHTEIESQGIKAE